MNSPYLQHIQSQKVFEKFLSLFCCHSFSSTGYILNTWVTNSCNFLFFLLLFSISSYFTFEKDAGWLAKNFPKLLRNCAVIPSGHFYSGKHFLKIEKTIFIETRFGFVDFVWEELQNLKYFTQIISLDQNLPGSFPVVMIII